MLIGVEKMKYGYEKKIKVTRDGETKFYKYDFKGWTRLNDLKKSIEELMNEKKDGVEVITVRPYRYKNEASNGHRDYYNKDFKLSRLTQI